MWDKNVHIVATFQKTKLTAVKNNHLLLSTFLQPIIDDFAEMSTGFIVTDKHKNSLMLKAHLVTVVGDMPAITYIMGFRGVNCNVPCRARSRKWGSSGTGIFCRLRNGSLETTKGTRTLWMPLIREKRVRTKKKAYRECSRLKVWDLSCFHSRSRLTPCIRPMRI
jgi:hypothetical protein